MMINLFVTTYLKQDVDKTKLGSAILIISLPIIHTTNNFVLEHSIELIDAYVT